MALQSLMTQTMSDLEACPLQEYTYVHGEDNLAVCREADDTSWEEDLFADLRQDQEAEEVSDDEEDEQDRNPNPTCSTSTGG